MKQYIQWTKISPAKSVDVLRILITWLIKTTRKQQFFYT